MALLVAWHSDASAGTGFGRKDRLATSRLVPDETLGAPIGRHARTNATAVWKCELVVLAFLGLGGVRRLRLGSIATSEQGERHDAMDQPHSRSC
jgi:hypothetical protein